jgi:hypothetical protein
MEHHACNLVGRSEPHYTFSKFQSNPTRLDTKIRSTDCLTKEKAAPDLQRWSYDRGPAILIILTTHTCTYCYLRQFLVHRHQEVKLFTTGSCDFI